jgi:hypothetical protein
MNPASHARSVGWIFVCIVLLGTSLARADATDAPEPPANSAAAPITDPARIDQHYREVLARPQFQELDEPAVNAHLEDELSQWFRRLGARIGGFKYTSRMPAFESILMVALVIFSGAVLVYVMLRLTRRRSKMEAEFDAPPPDEKTFRPPEFYDEEIRAAKQSGDWHAAWLATWRQFLARLENHRLVEADRTRTNREYLAQLRAQPLPATALALLNGMVDAYDRCIYGRQIIGESDWGMFHRQAQEAGLLLHLEDKAAPMRDRQEAL